jgi:hypothetical protein
MYLFVSISRIPCEIYLLLFSAPNTNKSIHVTPEQASMPVALGYQLRSATLHFCIDWFNLDAKTLEALIVELLVRALSIFSILLKMQESLDTQTSIGIGNVNVK